MIENAVIWVNREKLPFERTAGLSVLERQLHTLKRAGLKRVWIAGRRPSEERLAALRPPAGLEVNWAARRGDEELSFEPPYLAISGDYFIREETLRYVAGAGYPVHVSLHDASDVSVIQVIPFRTEDAAAFRKQPLPDGSTVLLQLPMDEGPVQDWLLSLGFKSQDGFMARNFDRYISLAFTRAIIDRPVSPNQMTVLSSIIGLLGTFCFLAPGAAAGMVGAALVWLHSVLDGCDGELARIRFQESDFGADIDFWGDNLVHISLFACLALGFIRAGSRPAALVLGLAAGAGIIGSAARAYARKLSSLRARREGLPDPEENADSLIQKIEQFLAQRDFIYLLLVMAGFGWTYYFLWAGAIGAPLFLAVTLLPRGQSSSAVSQSQTT